MKKLKPLERERKEEPLPNDEALTWIYVPKESPKSKTTACLRKCKLKQNQKQKLLVLKKNLDGNRWDNEQGQEVAQRISAAYISSSFIKENNKEELAIYWSLCSKPLLSLWHTFPIGCSLQHCQMCIKTAFYWRESHSSEREKSMLKSCHSRARLLSLLTLESESLGVHARFIFSSFCALRQFSHLQNVDEHRVHAWEFNSLFPWAVFGKFSVHRLASKPEKIWIDVYMRGWSGTLTSCELRSGNLGPWDLAASHRELMKAFDVGVLNLWCRLESLGNSVTASLLVPTNVVSHVSLGC